MIVQDYNEFLNQLNKHLESLKKITDEIKLLSETTKFPVCIHLDSVSINYSPNKCVKSLYAKYELGIGDIYDILGDSFSPSEYEGEFLTRCCDNYGSNKV